MPSTRKLATRDVQVKREVQVVEVTYMTISDAAKYVGVTSRTIHKWIKEDKIDKHYLMQLPSGRVVVNVHGLVRPIPKRPKTYNKVHQNIRMGFTHGI